MPKGNKWGGENSKAVEAKARKSTAEAAEKERKQKAAEAAEWEDDDKHIAKKQNRKDDKEKKRLEAISRKTTNKMLADEELNTIASSTSGKSQTPAKITQAQITAEREKREAAARKAAASNASSFPRVAPLPENLNLLPQPDEEVNTVDEALRMFSMDEKGGNAADRHPERRIKAAYSAYESIRLPELKAENPSLRLTQLKQMLFTEWQKSPENPMNQERLAYNTK